MGSNVLPSHSNSRGRSTKQLLRAEALSTGKTVSGLVREWVALCAHFVNEERLDLPIAA
jgi:hypothetical protein